MKLVRVVAASSRFSRPLSPKARKIFSEVTETVKKWPQYTPTPLDLIPASATLRSITLGYGYPGNEFADKIYQLIVNAKEEVLISSLLWAKYTSVTDAIIAGVKALNIREKKQHRKGKVRIYIAIDPFNALIYNHQLPPLRTIEHEKTILPAKFYWLPTDLSNIDLQMRSFHIGILGSLHSKYLIIDGKIAYFGSKNLDQDRPQEMMLELTGSVAQSLRQGDFETLWQDKLPPLRHKQSGVERSKTDAPVFMLSKKYEELGNRDSHLHNAMTVGMMKALEMAQHQVYIQTLNLCDLNFVNALIKSVKQKPKLKVTILTSFYSADAAMKFFPDCLGSNKAVVQYVKQRLTPSEQKRMQICWWLGWRLNKPVPQKNEWSHVKIMAIDEQIAIVGSANYDSISWEHQWESNILFDDKHITQRLLKALRKDQQSLPGHCIDT